MTIAYAAPAPTRRRRRWLLALLVAGWAVVVGGTALWSAAHDKPTAREQTTIAQALPTLDTAIADLVTAAGTDQTVAAISGYTQLDADCRVTTARSGSRFERAALLFTPAGTEPALLDRIAAGLPASYRPRVRHGGTASTHTLTVDAGDFVSVRATVPSPGTVRVAADTGCRPQDRPVSEAGGTADRAPVEAVFTALHATPTGWQVHRVACRGGGTLWTVEASGGPGSAPASLERALPQT
ncbi:MAG TPA: hypothetical protein VEK80_18665, partial [Kribbellaceae bacterium]|nr:hypothetical protein [Kribbellaceae bacterium]